MKNVFGNAECVLLEVRKMYIITGVCQNILVPQKSNESKYPYLETYLRLHAAKYV
jgi:hypothetical protein